MGKTDKQNINNSREEKRRSDLLDFILPGTPADIVDRYVSLSSRAENSDFGILDSNIVVLDTETTGFSFNHDELTQIAAAKMDKGEIVDRFMTFVDPGQPIPEEISHLTNIHDADVAGAASPNEALEQLVAFIGNSPIVAHNVEFDRGFTTKHPAGYSLLENTWIDSLDLARIALPRLTSHRLIDLVHAFDAPLSTHRADNDVEATCAVFRILLAAVEAMPTPLIREIAGMANSQQWSTSVVFAYFAQSKTAKETAERLKEQNASHTEDTEKAAANEDKSDASYASMSAQTGNKNIYKAEEFSVKKLRQTRLKKGKTANKTSKTDSSEIARKQQETADKKAELVFPSKEEIESAFSQSGLVSTLYEEYEARFEQLEMAQAVRQAFATSTNLMVEAGTGVGKSMAYLVPAALTACANNIPIGIATKTNALLDQLVCRELPALANALEPTRSLTFTALKGFSHYPCLRKIERVVSEGAKMKTIGKSEYSQAPALAALLSYIEQTEYDDIDALKLDYRVLPRHAITTTSRECLRSKCPYFTSACFVNGARQKAHNSHIIVTNHSLLFCDLVANNSLLPSIRYWVIDEAHNAENEIRKAFSVELSTNELSDLALSVSSNEAAKNVFLRARRNTASKQPQQQAAFVDSLMSRASTAGLSFAEAEAEFASHIKDLLIFDTSKKSKGYEYTDLWISDNIRQSSEFELLTAYGKSMAQNAETLISIAQELVGYYESLEGSSSYEQEIATLAMQLKDAVNAVDIIFVNSSQEYAYAARIGRKNNTGDDKIEALLFNVGETLNNTLYKNTSSVVFTSATLTVSDSFRTFEDELGLNSSPQSQCAELLLGSSFDFDQNMTVYVVKDIPEPNEVHYLGVLQKFLTRVHIAMQGSALTLFTNRREMEQCFEEVQPQLRKEDLRLTCQKWGVSTKGLRDDFLKDEHLSLFALKSFWEGFDAPGSTLKNVIIPKLPFSKPSDPLSCERAARDDQAWRRYVLPAAVLETKQAAGRLIRTANDQGILILADKRLITKAYGKTFLDSLPSKNIHVCSMSEIVNEISANNAANNVTNKVVDNVANYTENSCLNSESPDYL